MNTYLIQFLNPQSLERGTLMTLDKAIPTEIQVKSCDQKFMDELMKCVAAYASKSNLKVMAYVNPA